MTGPLLSAVCTLRSPPLPNDEMSPSSADRPPPLAAGLAGAFGSALKDGAAGGPGGGGAAEEENVGASGGGAGGAFTDAIGGGGGGGAVVEIEY